MGASADEKIPNSASSVPSPPGRKRPLRLLIFGTHPQQYNGYSKVIFELVQQLSRMEDAVRVFIFGFQNVRGEDKLRGDVPPNVTVYDAFAEENPKQQGFGIGQVKDYVSLCQPDVALIFNDMHIISAVLNELKDVPERKFPILTYIDQVYTYQRRVYIDFVNDHADEAIMFSPGWERCIKAQGLRLPTHFLPHGVNTDVYYPVPSHIVRKYYGFSPDDFLVLNMNRNQPRKRWDITLKAVVEVLRRNPGAPLKLIVATSARGGWNLTEIFDRELAKAGLDVAAGHRHIVFVDAPQRMTDREVNMLYNLCDIGVNTCDGEGFGLCNVEQAVVGKPQVVSNIGSFTDVFDRDCAILVEPRVEYYLDSSRDLIGGEARMCSYSDFADGIEKYMKDRALCGRHGQAARKRILQTYRWPAIARKLSNIVCDAYDKRAPPPAPAQKSSDPPTGDATSPTPGFDDVRSLMQAIDARDESSSRMHSDSTPAKSSQDFALQETNKETLPSRVAASRKGDGEAYGHNGVRRKASQSTTSDGAPGGAGDSPDVEYGIENDEAEHALQQQSRGTDGGANRNAHKSSKPASDRDGHKEQHKLRHKHKRASHSGHRDDVAAEMADLKQTLAALMNMMGSGSQTHRTRSGKKDKDKRSHKKRSKEVRSSSSSSSSEHGSEESSSSASDSCSSADAAN